MTQHLPPRRDARVIDYDLFDGYTCQGFSAHFSEFAPGDLGEVFLRPVGGPNAKVGMPLDTMAKDLSVLFSIARRYGAPVAVIVQALSQEKGGMMLGPLGEFLRLYAASIPETPDGLAVPVGTGGAGVDCSARAPEPADPKELQNDGDPIAEAAEIWPLCGGCGKRHSIHVHCTSDRRHTRVMQ